MRQIDPARICHESPAARARSRPSPTNRRPGTAPRAEGLSLRGAALVCLLIAALVCGACSDRAPRVPRGKPRIVSLAPNLTEILFAVGAGELVVGRTDACDFPPAAAAVPVVGGFGRPSLELLLQAEPTLVLDVDLSDESIGRKIDAIGLERVRVPCRSLRDIPEAMVAIGKLAGREHRAAELADAFRERVQALRAQAPPPEERSSVYVEIWHDPLMTAGGSSFVSELVELAGGRNIVGGEIRDYFQISPEWVVARNPDVILCLFMAEDIAPRELVSNRESWQSVTAVRRNAVYDGFDGDLLLRPGPRTLEGVEELRVAIQGYRQP